MIFVGCSGRVSVPLAVSTENGTSPGVGSASVAAGTSSDVGTLTTGASSDVGTSADTGTSAESTVDAAGADVASVDDDFESLPHAVTVARDTPSSSAALAIRDGIRDMTDILQGL